MRMSPWGLRALLAWVIFIATVATTTGCRKRSDARFYDLEASYSTLVKSSQEDVYFSPEMERVLAGLRDIPPSALEGAKAEAMVKVIEEERQRAQIAMQEQKAESARVEAQREAARRQVAPTGAPLQDTPALAHFRQCMNQCTWAKTSCAESKGCRVVGINVQGGQRTTTVSCEPGLNLSECESNYSSCQRFCATR